MSTGDSYEDLSGAVGRGVRFRTQRYRSSHLLDAAGPEIWLDGKVATLYDLSMNGMSVLVPEADGEMARGRVVDVRLDIAGGRFWQGKAKVVRFEDDTSPARVGLSLVDGFIDVPALQRLHGDRAFDALIRRDIALRLQVPESYRTVCCDIAAFLGHWKMVLDRREAELRERRALREGMADAESRAEETMRPRWRNLRQRANDEVYAFWNEEGVHEAARELTKLVVTPHVTDAPLLHRAYHKPRGYPGDYRMLGYMYDASREGDGAFARVMHQLGREERLAWTVPDRRDLLVAHTARVVEASPPNATVHITCIGSGPAREVADYLSQGPPPRKVVWTLVDQDEGALSFANERLIRIASTMQDRVVIRCLQVSFRQLFTHTRLLSELEGQHLVYSAGLFDYLRTPAAGWLVKQLYGLVRPGGEVLIGNASGEALDVRWMPEFVLDWQMIYRPQTELRAIAGAAEGARIQMESDRSESWHFARIVHPGSV